MRVTRLMLPVTVVCVLVALDAGLGLATHARPRRAIVYIGEGRLCQNAKQQQSKVSCGRTEATFSFTTSATGALITRLQGKAGPLSCTGTPVSFSTGSIPVQGGDSFTYRAGAAVAIPTRGGVWMAMTPRTPGQRVFVNGISVRGTFTGALAAHVVLRLLVDTSRPPKNEQCEAQVTGIAHAA